jgi:hypothetical protein
VRRAAKVDANQDAIVTALEAAGASVQSLAPIGRGCPDLLVAGPRKAYFNGKADVAMFLMEIKNPKGKDEVNDKQTKWHIAWNAPVYVVRSPDEALRVIGAIA